MVARIEGSDGCSSLCLMGHTDVVPVNPDGWVVTRLVANSLTVRCGAGVRLTC